MASDGVPGDIDRDVVYVAGRQNGGGNQRRAHVDRQCPALQRANAVFERSLDVYPDSPDWCEACTGEIDRSGPQDHSHYNALKAEADRS
jgi:hypothetical protein